MSELQNRPPLRRAILQKLKTYGQKAGELGYRVRQLVFGFRLRYKPAFDYRSLPVRLNEHRVLQRRRAFQKAGGERSSIAQYALAKARHQQQRW
jgi:hypothetical protein